MGKSRTEQAIEDDRSSPIYVDEEGTVTLLETALSMRAAGHVVVPVRPDGTKAPAVAWAKYATDPPGEDLLRNWFDGATYDGLGVLTGLGGLVMVEAEGRAVADGLVEKLATLMAGSGLGELWTRLCTGWMELTPSGGMHWYLRVLDEAGRPADVGPNTKLARRPGSDGTPVEVLFETRGTGGFTVTSPSTGRSHPTGKPWLLLAGSPATPAVLTVEEYDAVRLAMSTFDAMPVTVTGSISTAGRAAGAAVGERPGDDFNARASWDEILVPRGWTKGRVIGGSTSWTRPGKRPRDGISATTGKTLNTDGADRLYVFTTSTEFEAEKPYDKLGAVALLDHGGDIAAAAKALREGGYGKAREEPRFAISETSQAEFLALLPDPPPDSAAAVPAPPSSPPAARPAAPARDTLAHSDDANAMALVDQFGHLLRHCSDRGRWYAWNGHVWAECTRTAGPAREYAKQVARGLPEYDKADVAWKKKSLSAVGVSATLTSAASDPRVSVRYAELDAHPWEINTPGGIVDLRTGQISPSDPDKLHTRTTICTPDPAADCTEWLRFLHVTFGGDQALIGYLQRLVGYSAVGASSEAVLPFCYGEGRNGKGVFLETVVKTLGDYATTAPSGFLMATPYPAHETEIARLAGARMVLCSEVNEDDRFDEARVKLLTGGDTLTARFMKQDHFTFTPTHQLWSMGNHQPGVRTGGYAFWERLRLVPFEHTVPPEQRIKNLQAILAAEHGPAVLSWIVDGAVAYHQSGLLDPDQVRAATTEYARDQDTVSRFLDEACLIGGGEHVQIKASIVRQAYEAWCHETGDMPVSAKAFGSAMKRAGVDQKRSNGVRFYTNLALANDASGTDQSLDKGEWYR